MITKIVKNEDQKLTLAILVVLAIVLISSCLSNLSDLFLTDTETIL